MKKKILIYIVSFNHEKFIEKVLNRINNRVFDVYDTEILVSDDNSKDRTLEILNNYKKTINNNKFKFSVISNPVNQGYGGNQKIGYHYAIKNNFDYVVLLHGDGQYAPELIEDLLTKIQADNSQAVFGSRMMKGNSAIKGGMPLYKFIGNKILTYLQNKILKSSLSEFHSGYRVYSVEALKKIPFSFNSNDYSFDTEIIIQILFSNQKISEISIPTYYGEEISYVNGFYYAYRIMIETIKAKIQKFNIFYDHKYDVFPEENNYVLKDNFKSTHSEVIKNIRENSFILDIGCNDGSLSKLIMEKKNSKIVGVDYQKKTKFDLFELYNIDLNKKLPDIDYNQFDYILILDVIEHLNNPEKFLNNLYEKIKENEKIKIFISTGNVAFLIIRLMLMFGSFNYGKKGILDKTHTRLFTFDSFTNLLVSSNFRIVQRRGIPCPFPLVIKNKLFSKILIQINSLCILLSKKMFSYQMFFEIKPNPSLNLLLKKAELKAKNLK